MIWSKLKKSVMALWADAVKPHLQLYITRYGPGFSTIKTRAWMTWDGAEIVQFSTALWVHEWYREAGLRTIGDAPGEQTNVTTSAVERLEASGIYSSDDFYGALVEYVALPIDAALDSPEIIVRAVAMFDRRVGKRRLLAMPDEVLTDPLVRRCYELRCQAEGIVANEPIGTT